MFEAGNQGTIMVVDDTPANLRLISEMLQESGFKLLAFSRGQLALNAARRSPPDLVLLDINMPEMSGFEVCAQLKADHLLRDIPVIFISALADTSDKVKAFAAGGVDYITKPFQFAEVNMRVGTHLRLRKFQAELARHATDLEGLVREKVGEIYRSQLATIFALSKLAESRDDDTGRHIERTQVVCRMLAQRLEHRQDHVNELAHGFVENLFWAAPLHDIGKVAIPDSILLKPGRLTSEEFEVMKTHALLGAMTLEAVHREYPQNALVKMGIAVARHHHERWDGSGYPDGLSGQVIPLAARIMAVADVYDALRSPRPYKEAYTHRHSVKIIIEGSGRHFDPSLVSALMEVEEDLQRIYTAQGFASSASSIPAAAIDLRA